MCGFPQSILAFSHNPNTLTGYSKLPVHVHEWLSLCQPCDELSTCPGCTPPLAQGQKVLDLAPVTLYRISVYKTLVEGRGQLAISYDIIYALLSRQLCTVIIPHGRDNQTMVLQMKFWTSFTSIYLFHSLKDE